MIEMTTAVVDTFTTDEAQSGSVVGNTETESIRSILVNGLEQGGGEHHDLVGNGQRGQHPTTANDQPCVGFLLHPC